MVEIRFPAPRIGMRTEELKVVDLAAQRTCRKCGKPISSEQQECYGKLVDETCGGYPNYPPCEHEDCCNAILDEPGAEP